MAEKIILATRKSQLALVQTRMAQAALQAAHPGTAVELHEIQTTGDQKTAWSLEEQGGAGLFTKELEQALLDGRADVAVHSSKDLPTDIVAGLTLGAFLPRERVNDVLVRRDGVSEPKFIGTGSPRRRAQLKARFPTAVWSEIRGNVETRLNKVARGDVDASVLAAAGLKRLGIERHEGVVFEHLTPDDMVPAVGQGAIALQTREGETGLVAAVNDAPTAFAVELERAYLRGLGGGCHSAHAAHYHNGQLLTYHEDAGRQSYPITSSDLNAALAEVAEIVAELTGDG